MFLHCYICYFSIERFTNVKCKSLIDDVHQYWITRWFRILLSIAATVPCQGVDGLFSQYFSFVQWFLRTDVTHSSIDICPFLSFSGLELSRFSFRSTFFLSRNCVSFVAHLAMIHTTDGSTWTSQPILVLNHFWFSFSFIYPRPLPAGHFLFHRNLDPSYAESLRSTNYRGDYTTQSPIFVAGRFRTLSQWTLMEIYCDYYKTPSRI